jgi:tRNA(His) guanylyltransferase
MQKMVSVSASVFTGAFNAAFQAKTPAFFDSRVMVISQRAEAARYFLWRQLDASTNSLNMLASAHFQHADLEHRTTAEKHELLHGKGINWAKQPSDFKRGRIVKHNAKGWEIDLEIPVFNREKAYLEELIPVPGL